jgi:hypothetical protein
LRVFNKYHKKNKVIDGKKLCNKCDTWKVLSDYHNNKACSGGVTGTCRDCEWVRRKQWYADNRTRRQQLANERNQSRKQELVNRFGNKCFDCNSGFPICVYDFHHLDPSGKDMNPSAAMTLSEQKREKELAKCVMLCANCHRIRHFDRKVEDENARID